MVSQRVPSTQAKVVQVKRKRRNVPHSVANLTLPINEQNQFLLTLKIWEEELSVL